MPIIGVCNRKGGVGKTTTAVHLASEFAARGLSVELVDCDDQGSAVQWAEAGRLPVAVRALPLEGIEDIGLWAGFIRRRQTEYVVIDSPPRAGATFGAVVGLSDVVVVPCGPSPLDLRATADTVALVRECRQDRSDGRPFLLLVPNRTDMRTSWGKDLRKTLAGFGEPVAADLRARTAFTDACNAGDWTGSHAPNTPAHQDVVALADSVLAELGTPVRRTRVHTLLSAIAGLH